MSVTVLLSLAAWFAPVAGSGQQAAPPLPPPPPMLHSRPAQDRVVENRYRCGRRSARFVRRYDPSGYLLSVDAVRGGRRPPREALQRLLQDLSGTPILAVHPECFDNDWHVLILTIRRGDDLHEIYVHWDERTIDLRR